MTTRMNFPGRKKSRKEAAEKRAAEYALLTPKQKIIRLDKMFGKKKGAAKERAKLAKLKQTADA